MKELLLVMVMVFGSIAARGQSCTTTIIIKSDTIFADPEKHAYSEEGLESYMAWISNHMNEKLKSHDEKPPKTVYLSFIVDERGQRSNFTIVKGQGDPYDKEAIRLVKSHPHKWIPGQCDGRIVKTKVVSFVKF